MVCYLTPQISPGTYSVIKIYETNFAYGQFIRRENNAHNIYG
jgi:hypothetical protein